MSDNTQEQETLKTEHEEFHINRFKSSFSDAILITIVTGLFFLRGRIYLESYYSSKGVPIEYIEWDWRDTVEAGGFVSLTEIIYLLIGFTVYLTCKNALFTDYKKVREKFPEFVKNTVAYITMIIPLCVLSYLIYSLSQADSIAEKRALSYAKSPRNIEYILKGSSSKIQKASLLYYSPSGITYLSPEGTVGEILRVESSDFELYKITGVKKDK